MDLLDRFEKIFPDAQLAYILGDREFVGKEWLTYLLLDPAISFKLRIKKNDADKSQRLSSSLRQRTCPQLILLCQLQP